jgi:hypothetical protein
MYFYTLKLIRNENEQNELLEMCGHACLNFRNGKRIHVTTYLKQ